MAQQAISISIIGVFLVISLYLGIRASKGKKMNLEEWSVGGRGFGTVLIFLLMAGELYTVNALMGISGWAFGRGGAAFYNITMLNFIIGYWLLPKIWRYGKEHKLISQSDFFIKKYNSPALGVFVAAVGFVSMIPYLIIQLKGLGIIISEASYGMISPTAAIWVGVLAVTVYVMFSGIHGSAWTAVIKDILIVVVVVFLGLYLPFHYFGGIGEMFKAVETAKPGFLGLEDKGYSTSWYVSSLILLSLGYYMWPHGFIATYAGKNARSVRKNTLLLPIYMLFTLFVLFIGTSAVLHVDGISNNDVAIFAIVKQTFSPWVVGLLGAAGLLTALVPGSMLLMTTASLVANNVVKALRPSLSDRKVMTLARWLVPVVALIALICTFNSGSAILLLMLSGYGFVSQLTPAVVCSFLKWNPLNKYGVFAGVGAGVLIVAYINLVGANMGTFFPTAPSWFQDLNVGITALLANIIVSLIVSALTRSFAANKSNSAGEPATVKA
ncbi:sodium:solute symporter [Paenibacillus terreus]|uniref:Sodium:solute symporter n=1 Tax=Paenibacillus terreus TaxID=1387834 RepID=A0ABV5B5I5_9BACL